MTYTKFSEILKKAITAKIPLLVKGQPGIGKTGVVESVTAQLEADIIVCHPVVDEPTDYKGLPAKMGDTAVFLPYENLATLQKAEKLTVCFFDDLGQAHESVQKAIMQLIYGRKINGKRISDNIVFIGATNDIGQKAGVKGIIEPLKSRFASIIELQANFSDWKIWAAQNGISPAILAFLENFNEHFNCFNPTNALTNQPCPRTWHYMDKWIKLDVVDKEVFCGCVGESAGCAFYDFLTIYGYISTLIKSVITKPNLTPSVREIIEARGKGDSETIVTFALLAALSSLANENNLDNIFSYCQRTMQGDFKHTFVKIICDSKPSLKQTAQYIDYCTKNFKE